MEQVKLTTRNIAITTALNNGRDITAFINQPTKEESIRIAKVLGYIYTQASKNEIDLLVLAQDWEIYLDDFLQGLRNPEETKNELKAFFERRIDTATIFYNDTGETVDVKVDDEAMTMIKGFLLFFSAILRFASQAVGKSKMRDFFTSLSASEFQEFLKKSSKDAKQTAQKKQ